MQFQDPHRLGSLITDTADMAKAKKRRNESLKKKFLRGLVRQVGLVLLMLSPFAILAMLVIIFA